MRIAVCFFGLSRSLRTTHESIRENVLDPCRRTGETVSLAHLYYQGRVTNVRSGEDAVLDPDDYRLLDLDAVWLQFKVPAELASIVERLKPFGDEWNDGFSSLNNLIRQLYSLSSVYQMTRLYEPDVVLFCRPDLIYHDSLEKVIRAVAVMEGDVICVPDWQHWKRGYNDRFAVCRGERAAFAYASRLNSVHDYVEKKRKSLHAEKLLRHVVETSGVEARVFPEKASRVRAGGVIHKERFSKRKAVGLQYIYPQVD